MGRQLEGLWLIRCLLVVDEGNVDWEEGKGVEVVDPPPAPPPSDSGSSKPRAPSPLPPGRRGRSPGQPRCWSRAVWRIDPFCPPPRIAT